MKKAPLLAIAIATIGVFSLESNAQSIEALPTDTQPTEASSTQLPPAIAQARLENSKQQITVEELPDGVKKALKSDVLKEWQVSEIYRVIPVAQGDSVKPTYEVLFRNAEKKRAVARYNEKGKAVADKE